MKFLIIIVISFFSLSNFAQAKYSTTSEDFILYHEHISTADRMYKHDSLLQAFARYEIAFNNYKGTVNPGHYFRAALCAIKMQEEFKALHFLEKAIINGYEIDSNKTSLIVFNNQNTNNEYKANIGKWTEIRDAGRNANWQNELYKAKEDGKKYTTSTYKTAVEFCTNCLKSKTCSKTTPDYLSKYKLVKEKIKADSIAAAKLRAF